MATKDSDQNMGTQEYGHARKKTAGYHLFRNVLPECNPILAEEAGLRALPVEVQWRSGIHAVDLDHVAAGEAGDAVTASKPATCPTAAFWRAFRGALRRVAGCR